MTWTERWQLMDPAKVLERKQDNQSRRRRGRIEIDPFGALWARGKLVMTYDESAEVETLLMCWYGFEQAWRPNLGGGRASSYCKQALSESDPSDAAVMLDKLKAETVAKLLDMLSVRQRAAVGIHCANKRAGISVFRNPRMTPEQHHQQYQQAKADLLPLMRAEGMIRTPPAKPLRESVASRENAATLTLSQLARLERATGGLAGAETKGTITLRGILKKCLPSASA